MPEIVTHSRLACMRDCPRRHQLRYEHGLVPATESYARSFGIAYHRCHEEGTAWMATSGLDPYMLASVTELYLGWPRGHVAEYVAVERIFERDVVNPETGAKSKLWRSAGVVDAIVRLENRRLAILERKTTSEDITPGADYWKRLELDTQTAGYFVGARAAGFDVSAVLYDVSVRPELRPLRATPVELRRYTKPTKKEPVSRLHANQRERDETVAEYGARVRAKIEENPSAFFAQREVPMTTARIEEYHRDVWWQQIALRSAQRSGHWYRNPEACARPGGRTCDYLSICHLSDTEKTTPGGFIRTDDPHPELTRAKALQTTKEGI